MTDKWRDLIRRELTRPEAEPATDSFYRSVWNRIRTIEAGAQEPSRSNPIVSLGGVCWRSAPIFAALLLALSFWIWYNPPDLHPDIMSSSESYVLDAEEAPSNTSLLYQITHAVPISESESK